MAMKRFCFVGILIITLQLLFPQVGFSQADSAIILKEVVVSGLKVAKITETPINISSLSVQKMRANGSLNISDALAKLPGTSQLNTGPGISKPVIRGLYGNRITVLLSGLRFDNQQWQDEHGMGLNDIGIDRVEIIKGPMALIYGSEAIGGVINIIEEAPAARGIEEGEVNARLFSNTYGLYADVGFKGAGKNQNWRIRGGINSNADYSDGDNKRILNSRFGGYYLKGSLGFTRKNWTSYNNYNGSLDNFGFITADNQGSKEPDGRLSRTMDGPHHTVLLNALSSQNTVRLTASIIKLNVGLQSNLRLENEGGNKISLNMLLSTFLYNFQWVKPLNSTTEVILVNQSIFENNTNFGSRIIIPDANMLESGASFFVKKTFPQIILETGAGLTIRDIHSFKTAGVNTPDREIQPFNKTKPSINGAFGLTFNPNKNLNAKINFSSGFRSGNLAELSSNGLHEGTLRWEIGNPNLKMEQNINSETSVNYDEKNFSLSLALFYNYFSNYIFLSPTGIQYLGFDVFRFKQANANLYGGEASFGIHPANLKWLKYKTEFSTTIGKLSNGDFLPFMPSAKLHNEVSFSFNQTKKNNHLSFNVNTDNIFAQTHPAQFETETSSYFLLNAGGNIILRKIEREITISIAGNNLLNKNYYDHLSRFKEYGIHNIGRNVTLNINYPFFIKKQKK
jgi:iron complex outermembrane receptor protein